MSSEEETEEFDEVSEELKKKDQVRGRDGAGVEVLCGGISAGGRLCMCVGVWVCSQVVLLAVLRIAAE